MVITLYGPDTYRRDLKKKALIREFEKKHSGLGVAYFNLEESGLEPVKTFAAAQSMFSPAKLAVVINPFEESGKAYAEFLKNIAGEKHSVLLLVSDTKPLKAFSFLLPGGKSKEFLAQEFEHLTGTEWKSFIVSAGKERGVELEPAALALLSEVYEKNSWGLITELDKLSLLNEKKITGAHVESLAVEIAPNFFEMIGGLKNVEMGKRLRTLERLLSRNEPAAKIFNILAYQWPERLQAIASYDIAVKTGKCEYEEVLADLLLA